MTAGPFRSFLFTPGNHPDKVAKVFGAGADAAILDLEDAVALDEKEATRATTVVDGIVLPKVESAADLQSVDSEVGRLEREQGMEPETVDILPIIETAKGLDAVSGIAGCGSRVRRLSFGAVDFAKDLGLRLTPGEWETIPARSAIVLASRVSRLEQPIDSVFVHYRDTEGLKKSTEQTRDLGFQGRFCIHPDQVGPPGGRWN